MADFLQAQGHTETLAAFLAESEIVSDLLCINSGVVLGAMYK